MAWTTPRTWVALELVTATQFNTHIRDNLNAIAAGNTVRATLSASVLPFANITEIGTVTLTTHGGPVLVTRRGAVLTNSSGVSQGTVFLTLYVDDVAYANTLVIPNEGGSIANSVTSHVMPAAVLVTGLSAAAHEFAWRDNIGDGTSSWSYSGVSYPMVTDATEVGF